jgi:hypothetical protein
LLSSEFLSIPEIRREEIVIEQKIGAGAFATVHKGFCRGNLVAIKSPKASIFHGFTKEQLKAFK